MTALVLTGVEGAVLRRLDATLEAGVSALVADGAGAAAELVAFVAGASRPLRGRVTADGAEPHRSPALRSRIGALLVAEEPWPGATLEIALGRLLALRSTPLAARDVLGAWGLGGWAGRRPASLAPDELRRVALALALSTPAPLALALVEPLAAGLPRSRVVEALESAAAGGAIVLAVVARLRDAEDLGGRLLALEPGRGLRVLAPLPVAELRGEAVELVVRADDPRRLAARLSLEADVASVAWDGDRAPAELVVRGPDVERASTAVLRAAEELGVLVVALHGRVAPFDRPRLSPAPTKEGP